MAVHPDGPHRHHRRTQGPDRRQQRRHRAGPHPAAARSGLAGERPVAWAERLRQPGYAHTVTDVTDPGFGAVLAELSDARGPFDLVVHCAGIAEAFDVADMAAQSRVFAVKWPIRPGR
ncbi:hypothetical protein SGFS_005030 [Streptomyces graminofaciens]|jgi:NAD(P)-dependent dehydrogenase (short-subunit alcohol dehydrogenase family)|uniref:SDR family NAD(P)-dependent oxidoreductase n=1 Tax=Streptomyces graminofaciens TaxID=68212 RepID=A0ABM7F0I2_9ACTN|nr:hypothetical protein [Streptomyces graminofaciens]BBC29212.1 hypothetical protein SGFS_005030 [Streptomyces graminofaciens]